MLREFEDKENILADMDEQVGRLCRSDDYETGKQIITGYLRVFTSTLLSDQIYRSIVLAFFGCFVSRW
jgi:hypothetical protein